MPAAQHPYADFIHKVKKPARYLGGEHGEIAKDWGATFAKVCLCFPDVYEVGMSHLGFKILYSILNKHPKLLAERAYAPWIDMEQELRARNEPLRSLESFRALSDFDVVGFSLQFELTFTNILQMLELGGIPLRSCERQDSDPLVIAGGPTATHPEPLSAFIDAFLIGDGEERTPEIALLYRELLEAGVPRQERLFQLAQLPGVYVPSLYETETDPDTGQRYVARSTRPGLPLPVQRTFVTDISAYPFPKDGPIASTETVFDRVSIEIARGCTEGCRFCQAGMIYRPVRERDPAEIIDVLRHAVREGGYDSASLTSLSTADYSAISPLVHSAMTELRKERATLSVSSLRAYGLAEDVLDELKDGGGKGLTFAPEAGTQRMRDVINKNVTEEQLLETARRVFSRGFSRMKLYFMIGLPTETDEDVLGIVETGARALAVGRELIGRAARVTVSVSTHVPKPHTPFQWCAMDEPDEVRRKQRLVRDAARRAGVELKMHDSLGSFLEGVISRGDRSLCDVIYGAYRRGARFDSWEEQLRLDYWQEAMDEAGVSSARFLGTLPTSAKLPWDHIDVTLAPGFLAREYRKALKDRLSPPCGKAVGMFVHHTNLEEHEQDRRKLVCYHCGVACDMEQMRTDRAAFLIKLGAKKSVLPLVAASAAELPDSQLAAAEPGADAAPPPLPPPPRAATPARPPRARPPERPDQGSAMRVRLGYRKVGRAAFSSHLDLVRLLPRLFRRLDLPLYYSLGFHSKPVLVFGPALSLGVASLAEYVDLKLCERDDIDWKALPAMLSEATIDGVEFFEARRLRDGEPKLSAMIDEASYVAGLPLATLSELGFQDAGALREVVAARSGGELRTRRLVDGIGKWVDVHRYLREVAVGDGEEFLSDAGIGGELLPIRFRLEITDSGSAKASEVLETLLNAREVPARIVRTALGWRAGSAHGTPFDLERYAAARAAVTIATECVTEAGS
jgi:radical SAM family uncharacterized protein/radical SAM-linked protein